MIKIKKIQDYFIGKVLTIFVFTILLFSFALPAQAASYPELCSVLTRTFGYGESGEDVKRLQIVLGQEGIAYIAPTSFFGPVTRNAVKVFQLRNGIRQTGAVGPLTLARMKVLWCQNISTGTNTGGNTGGDYNVGNNGILEVSVAPISSSGQNITLGWNSKNANSCNINGESVSVNGQKIYTIYSETNYTIACTGFNGANVSKTITIKPNQSVANLPSVNVYINPSSVLINTYATLYWISQNATSCNLNGQSVSTSGSQQVYVTNQATQYRVTCTGLNNLSSSAMVSTGGVVVPNTNTNNNGIPIPANQTTDAVSYRGQNGTILTFDCPANNFAHEVWGTDIYSDDSSICSAAVHAGRINFATGGRVQIQIGSEKQTFLGTTRNGVVSQGYGYWPGSFTFVSGTNVNPNTGTASISVSTNKSTYSIGEIIYINVTVTNNSTNNVTFPKNTCPDFGLKIDGIAYNDYFYNGDIATGIGSVCTMQYEQVTLTPGQSRTFNYQTTVKNYTPNGVGSYGTHNLTVNIPDLNINAQTTFTVGTVTCTTTCNNNNITLTANPTYVNAGQSTILTWSAPGANSCSLSGPSFSLANQAASGSYTLYPTGTGTYIVNCTYPIGGGVFTSNISNSGSASVVITVSNSNTSNLVSVSPTTVSTSNTVTFQWKNARYPYATGALFELINSSGSVVGTIKRYPNTSTGESFNHIGSATWVIPKSVIDSRNDSISCQIIGGENLCGNIIYSGQYKVRATYFSPSNACFGFCQTVSGQQVYGTEESASFYITSTVGTGNTNTTPTLTVTPSSTSVNSGQGVTLTINGRYINSSNANACTVTGGIYSNSQLPFSIAIEQAAIMATLVVYPTVTTTYNFSCLGSNGQTATAQAVVTVGNNSNITANITANQTSIAPGQPVTISWTSTNATYCNIVANGSSVLNNQAGYGSNVFYPAISTNYVLNCYNNSGQNAASFVYVTLNGNNNVLPTANIYASSQNVSAGQQVTLNWYSSNASYCSLSGNGNSITSNQNVSGTYLVTPTVSTNYQVTCTNTNSNQSASAYVYVTVNGGNSGTTVSVNPTSVTISSGQSTGLIFSVANASYCNLNGGVYNNTYYSGNSLNTTLTVSPTQTTTYTATCYNSNGQSTNASSVVTVNGSGNLGSIFVSSNINRNVGVSVTVPNVYGSTGVIDWGDGNTNMIYYSTNGSQNVGSASHYYGSSGTYNIKLLQSYNGTILSTVNVTTY